jgi:large subunit ribosomal protein L25
MRQMVDLAAEPRTKLGKGPAYQTRRQGKIPGIVYGGTTGPETVQVDERSFGKLYQTGAMLQTLVMLDVGGRKTRVLPRAVQVDPVSDQPIHVDFMRLEPGARVRIAIPVRFRGHENSPGLKLGGVINVVTHEIELYCSADSIPDYIEGNLEGLEIGDSLHISDFALPEGVKTVIQGRNFTVASISPPTTYVEEVPAAGAAEAAVAEGVAVEGGEAAAAAPGAAAPAAGAAAPAAGAAAPAAAAPAAAAAKGKAPEKGKK